MDTGALQTLIHTAIEAITDDIDSLTHETRQHCHQLEKLETALAVAHLAIARLNERLKRLEMMELPPLEPKQPQWRN